MITIRHLKKEYPSSTPLVDVNVEIKKGDVFKINFNLGDDEK